MNVRSLEVSNFRNIETLSFEPGEGVNVIYGENAQGKSNLLEAIWLFTGLRSFRGSKDRELIRFGEEQAGLDLVFDNDVREMTAGLTIGEKKKAVLGGVPQETVNRFMGEFLAIVFAPSNLELVRGGPSERRKFLNQTLQERNDDRGSALSLLPLHLRTRKGKGHRTGPDRIPVHGQVQDARDQSSSYPGRDRKKLS